jgi:cytochrome c553
MKRIATLLLITGLAAAAMAMTAYDKVFDTKYDVKAGSALATAACKVCHTTVKGGPLNKYGKDLQAALKAANTKKMTPAILAAIENLDSNGDGVKNGASIKQDKLP